MYKIGSSHIQRILLSHEAFDSHNTDIDVPPRFARCRTQRFQRRRSRRYAASVYLSHLAITPTLPLSYWLSSTPYVLLLRDGRYDEVRSLFFIS
jgi:hypothetical protein